MKLKSCFACWPFEFLTVKTNPFTNSVCFPPSVSGHIKIKWSPQRGYTGEAKSSRNYQFQGHSSCELRTLPCKSVKKIPLKRACLPCPGQRLWFFSLEGSRLFGWGHQLQWTVGNHSEDRGSSFRVIAKTVAFSLPWPPERRQPGKRLGLLLGNPKKLTGCCKEMALPGASTVMSPLTSPDHRLRGPLTNEQAQKHHQITQKRLWYERQKHQTNKKQPETNSYFREKKTLKLTNALT